MQNDPPKASFRFRIHFGPDRMLGPGKVELLERIARTGSIAAAGREMGMSYKRAWQLVDTLNGMFRDPVVERSRGGAQGGGASLTETGRMIVAEYRTFEARAEEVAAPHVARLSSLLSDIPDGK